MGILRFKAAGPRSPKVTANLSLTCNLSLTIEKIKFCLFKKAVFGFFRPGITTGKCKTKTIQANLGIFIHIPTYLGTFRHNQIYPGIILVYSEPCAALVYLEP